VPAHGYHWQAAARGTGMLGRGGLRRRSASIERSSPSRYQQAAAPVGRPQLRQAPIAAGPQPHRDGGLGPGAGTCLQVTMPVACRRCCYWPFLPVALLVACLMRPRATSDSPKLELELRLAEHLSRRSSQPSPGSKSRCHPPHWQCSVPCQWPQCSASLPMFSHPCALSSPDLLPTFHPTHPPALLPAPRSERYPGA
jgi:hypothetical protein